MTTFFEHTAEGGERWDDLAYRYYGDARRTTPILLANPAIVADGPGRAPLSLEAGTVVRIPVLPDDAPSVADLPPWRRP